MLLVRRLRPDEWGAYRELRLTALTESPAAFSSTFARESAWPDERWRERLEQADGEAGCPLVATLDGAFRGLAWCVPDRDRPTHAALFQMWIAPEARGRGAGAALIDACVDWAAARGYPVLSLECMADNAPARRLYERCGFTVAGTADPVDADDTGPTVRMERDLGDTRRDLRATAPTRAR